MRFAWGIPTCVTALAKVTVGVFTTVVPPAPAVADPILTTVVDPAAPPVPRFRVLDTPVGLIPVPIPYVAAVMAVPIETAAAETVTVPDAVSVPMMDTAPDAVSEPEKVLLPVKVCVPARIANSLEVFGRANVRVVPVVIPDRENSAFLVGSASFTRLNTASDTSTGSPTRSQDVPFQTTKVCSAATHASQPGRGTNRIQTPSIQKATFKSHPAQRPVAPDATICRSPSVGLTGGAVRVRSSTESCTIASRSRSASLWVTCFWACDARM